MMEATNVSERSHNRSWTAAGNPDPEVEDYSTFELVIPGLMLSLVGVLGLVGNLLAIFILSRPQMKGSTNCILIGLASSDSILIITSILMFGLPALANHVKSGFFSFYTAQVFPYVTPLVYPIGLIAQSSSVYLTLLVTIERYVAVCSPLRARSLCTYGRARICVLCISLAALIYNIPRFLEVTWVSHFDASLGQNRTEVRPTPLRQDPTYISIYITWMYLVVMYIVPFVSLALLNWRIYIQIRRSTAERATMTRHEQREIGMATMLLGVVMVFFVCNVLALVVNVLELMSIAITALTQVSNLLVTLNSSVNFIIYIIYGEKFQRLFLLIFCQRHQRQDQMLHRRFTTSTYQATAANPGSQSHNGLYSSRTRPTRSRAREAAAVEETEDLEAMMGPTPSEARAISALVDWGLEPPRGDQKERKEDIPLGQLKANKRTTGKSSRKENGTGRQHPKRRNHHCQQVRSASELKVTPEVENPDLIICEVSVEPML